LTIRCQRSPVVVVRRRGEPASEVSVFGSTSCNSNRRMGTPRHAIPTSVATYVVRGLFLSFILAAARKAPARTTAEEWPKSFSMSNGATLTIHQPQIAEWPNEEASEIVAMLERHLPLDARVRAEGVERSRTASRLRGEWGVRAASYRPSAINSRGGQ